jgi:hypothetical protein
MPSLTIEYQTDAERIDLETSHRFRCRDAPDRRDCTLRHRPRHLREPRPQRWSPDAPRNARIDPPVSRRRPKKAPGDRSKGRRSRDVMTALGRIELSRHYVIRSGEGEFPGDGDLGVDGFTTMAARRMAALAGVKQPFARAARLLDELCGWSVDDETIRRITHETAAAASQSRRVRMRCRSRRHLARSRFRSTPAK